MLRSISNARKLDTVSCALFFLFVIATPVYVFASGLPQPAHLALVGAVMWFLLHNWKTPFALSVPMQNLIALLGSFILYVLVINTYYAIEYSSWEPIRHFLFYAYGWMTFTYVLIVGQSAPRQIFQVLTWGFATALGMLVALSILNLSNDLAARSTLLFNNPNQLGYFALLGATFVLFLRGLGYRHRLVGAACFIAALYLSILAASRAAIVGIMVLFLIDVWADRKERVRMLVGATLVMLLLLWRLDHLQGETRIVGTAFERFSAMEVQEDEDDRLEARGYRRLIDHPQYLPLGAGEGLDERFEGGKEMHSTLGVVLFSYGMLGTLIFGLFLRHLIARARPRHLVYALPTLVYGLAHNGFRQPLLWALLALIATVGGSDKKRVLP